MNGRIKSLNLKEGKGSILTENDTELRFYQASLSTIRILELKLGDRVSFDLMEMDNHRLNAIHITRYKSILKTLPLA